MKTTSMSKFALGLVGILTFLLLSLVLTPFVAGGITLSIATGTAISGGIDEQTVRTEQPGLDMEDVSKMVTWMNPSKTPIDTILREVRESEKIESMIKRYYSVASKALYDIPDQTASGDGTSASVPAKSYTYSSGAGLKSIYVAVTNEAIWSVKDTCLMRDLTLTCDASGNPVVGGSSSTIVADVAFRVDAKSGSVLRLQPTSGWLGINSGGVDNSKAFVVPTFADTTKLYRMGRAMHEKDASTTAFGIIPDYDEQYCQSFMAQVEESVWQRMTKKEVPFNFSDYERQNIYDMRAVQEMSFLWGAKGWTTSLEKSTEKIYTTQGIIRDITKKVTYGTGGTNRSVSFADIVDMCKSVFVGNSGSDERFLFAGADLIGALHSVETIQKQINGKAPVTKWGIKFTEIVTNFGMLYINHHPLMTATGWSEKGVILDFEHIRKHDFIPMQVKKLDLITPGTSNVDATVLNEVSCLTLAYPDCHAVISPKG